MPVPDVQRFEKFFQATSDCQFYAKRSDDGQFRYVHVNSAALKLLDGTSEHEILGLTPKEALGEDYGSTVERNIKTAYETGQTHHFYGSLGNLKTGPIYDAFYYPLTDDDGNVAGVLGSARDVSEISRLNGIVLHNEKIDALGTIAGSVVHDFNNILGAFQSLMDLLEGKSVDEDRRKVVFREGRRTLKNGKALTDRLTKFARREQIKAVPHDVGKLIDICKPVLQRVLGRRVQLSIECEDGLWKACCDRSEFEMALVNLATNARDAMGTDGHVIISARNGCNVSGKLNVFPDGFVEVKFSDNGSGMDQMTIERAMEPFYTTKDEGKGTGLGLSSIAKFVREIGGTIHVESKVGIGTSISLFLPTEKIELRLQEKSHGISAVNRKNSDL